MESYSLDADATAAERRMIMPDLKLCLSAFGRNGATCEIVKNEMEAKEE